MNVTNTNTVAAANLTAWDPRLSGALKTDGKAADDAKLKKACQEMEGRLSEHAAQKHARHRYQNGDGRLDHAGGNDAVHV